jgi:hypothetical protein
VEYLHSLEERREEVEVDKEDRHVVLNCPSGVALFNRGKRRERLPFSPSGEPSSGGIPVSPRCLPPPGARGGMSSDCDDDILEKIVPFLSLCAIGNDVVQ